MNWWLILFPLWAPALWAIFLVLVISAYDHQRVRAQRRFYAEEEARAARRTPEEVERDNRAACIACFGFDPTEWISTPTKGQP